MSPQRSPVAHIAYPPQPSKLPAPLWHTGILLLYVLVPPIWWPGWTRLLRTLPYNSASFDILRIAIYTAVVAFVCLGLSLRQTPLEQMIGQLWTSWKSALRDIAIGLGLWLVARYADRLIYYLAPYPPRARLLPHTKGELLISIFCYIVVGVTEELIFRGYLQKQFTALCRNLGAGLLIQAFLFALFHGYHQLPGVFCQHFLFGLMAGMLAHWRKSLLPGMIGHAWFDAYWNLLRIVGLK
ncbi:MAG TPA: type II CAAX endopeptidase family protein [Candidatus Angelobacter sp.]